MSKEIDINELRAYLDSEELAGSFGYYVPQGKVRRVNLGDIGAKFLGKGEQEMTEADRAMVRMVMEGLSDEWYQPGAATTFWRRRE